MADWLKLCYFYILLNHEYLISYLRQAQENFSLVNTFLISFNVEDHENNYNKNRLKELCTGWQMKDNSHIKKMSQQNQRFCTFKLIAN